MEKPCPGGEKRRDGRASPHEAWGGDGVVAPPGRATGVSLSAREAPDWYHASGAAVDLCGDAPAEAQRAAHAADGGMVDVWPARAASPRVRRMHAQRVARWAPYHAHNGLPPKQ